MKDPVAEAYARGGRVARQKMGEGKGGKAGGRARQSAELPKMEVRSAARPARMPAPPMPRPEAAPVPARTFPVRSARAGAVAMPPDDAVAVDLDQDAMRRGGRVRR